MRNMVFLLSFGVSILLFSGCKSGKEPDCAPAPAAAQPETKEPVDKGKVIVSAKDADWCRACVVGPKGYMSCKKVDGTPGPEHRSGLRARARLEACLDSGFTEESCPKENVMAIVCKGDAEPNLEQKTETAKRVLKALKNSGPLVLKKPAANDKEAENVPSPAPDKPEETAQNPEKGKEVAQ